MSRFCEACGEPLKRDQRRFCCGKCAEDQGKVPDVFDILAGTARIRAGWTAREEQDRAAGGRRVRAAVPVYNMREVVRSYRD